MRPRVTAVAGLDLDVHKHEVFGLLGPNGSGKSTTIKIILGLLFPTKGRVKILGKLPSDVLTKKHIGYLPEESYLYRFLNARETLDYYGRLFHQDRRTRQKRIDELLKMVGLDAVQRRPIGEFSKGMQRRIGLAQALINDPDLLILDEPTTGLDPIGTRQIKDIIVMLKERGKTVVLSSHLLSDVEDVCDRVTILYGGKKRREGTVDELLVKQDTTVMETSTLKPETITKIEQLIEAEEGKCLSKVHAQRQRLEALFLEIVEKARSEGATTSGALSGGGMAGFLSEGERRTYTDEEPEGEALIDELVKPSAPEPVAATTPAAPSVEETEARERDTVIDQLVKGDEPPPLPKRASGDSTDAASDDDDQPDRSVIDDLL
ncbi:MAG: ATP-binding cassette domain-containing protein [Phycisphaera sp.]|nr:ATP-binding cassette domain-containing protein [Phycisphaera sp.]